MEGKLSPELAQTPEPESSQDLDSSSQANTEEPKPDQEHADATSVDQAGDTETSPKTSGELKKTWGFRRTTIAKRDMAGEMSGVSASPDARGAPVRRSGRQAKRTDKLEEFLVTVKRGRGGRRSAPAQLDHDPPSETTSEASFDGNAEAKTAENKVQSPARRTRSRGRGRQGTSPTMGHVGSVSDDDDSSENEEETRAETQDKTASDVDRESVEEHIHEDAEQEVELQTKDNQEEVTAVRRSSRSPAKTGDKDDVKSGPKGDEDDEESSSSSSDNDGYDPNALYCICRQKHNKRFMICCDRCEEWFHGDCVGITEARGRLMERNGEDYVCPKCSSKKSQTAKPSASSGLEGAKPGSTAFELRKGDPAGAGQSTTPAAEDKPGEEMGIKGRIEKATNPSGKKKIKIFQPVLVAAEGASSLPKCIGPGCERDALPESVYCGNDCILKHAAAAMKIFKTEGKEKTKPKTKKAAAKTTPKSPVPERRSSRRSTSATSKIQEESSDSETQNDDAEDDEDKVAEEHPPPPAMSSWSSDHNYIAVAPEKTTPISPSVLNKACMYLEGFPHFNELSHSITCCRTDYITHNRPERTRLLL